MILIVDDDPSVTASLALNAFMRSFADVIRLPPDARQNLFTPFFSTKEHGQGIGLTLVQEILEQHHLSTRSTALPAVRRSSRSCSDQIVQAVQMVQEVLKVQC